jgi:Kdo2-lipid IVA lauroyltransferase/acyltransferase
MSASLLHRLEYGMLRGAVGAMRALPLDTARWLGAVVTTTGYAPLGIRRAVVVRQIAAAFPGLSDADVRRLARRSYAHLGRVSVETALLPTLGREGVLSLFDGAEGFDRIEAAHTAGRGIILITGHFGNWELAGAYVAARGVPIEVITRRMNNPLFDAYLTRTRERSGMRVIHDADAVRRIPRAFRDGHAVAFVADQGVLGLASTFVPFFGRPAKTPRGPAVFALRFGVPVFFCAAVREASRRYRFLVSPVEVTDAGDREADVDAVVTQFTGILERCVRRYPEQYFWHHRRWKRQPLDTPLELRDPVRYGVRGAVDAQ